MPCRVDVFVFLTLLNRCPGMYNALNGLGGAGQLDPTVQNNATVALFATFAVVAFFSGAICNKLGVRLSLIIGSSG
jgi:hypothetical protein